MIQEIQSRYKRAAIHYTVTGVLLVCCALTATVPAVAESRKIGGLFFEVEEIVQVDRRAVRVTVDGETRIVPKDEVDDFIVSKKLESDSWHEGHSVSALMGFAKEGLRIHKFDRARKVLSIVLGSKELSQTMLESFLEEMLKAPAGIGVVQEALVQISKEDRIDPNIVSMILVVGRHDSPWIRAHLLKFCFSHRDKIFEQIDRHFQVAIANQDFERARTFWKLGTDVYGHADEKVQQIQLIYNKLKLARRALASGEVEQLYPLIPLTEQSPELRAFLSPILLNAFHQEGSRSLSRGGSSRVLNIMTQIPHNQRTETTIKLVEDSLLLLAPSPKSVLLEDHLWQDVVSMSEKNPQIKAAASKALLVQIDFFLQNRAANQIDPFLERLKVFRPDPDQANDRIRLKQALVFNNLGDRASASEKLEEMSVFGISEYAYLLYTGYYIDLYLLLILGLMPALIAVMYKIFCKIANAFAGEVRESDNDDDDEEEEVAPGGFSYISLKRGLSPRMHEYVGLLRKFDLGPEANMKVIKAAYRSAVKEVHPDLHDDSVDDKAAELFRALNERYERILELRKSLGYPEN